MTDIAVPEARTVALRLEELNPEQVALIKTTYAKGATDDELRLFIIVCNQTQLSPFLGQIHAVKRAGVMAYQVGIGGFRLQAQRSKAKGGPAYEGPTDVEWCDDKGNWTDLWLKEEPPYAARTGVRVEGYQDPVFAIAEYKRLVQRTADGKPNVFWNNGAKAAFQLGKCAEAAAIRKGFPNETSRLYLKEEMYDIPEEKDITPPMTLEEHKKALLPPAGPEATLDQSKDEKTEKPAAGPGEVNPVLTGTIPYPGSPDKRVDAPKGEAIIPPEHRQKVIAHLQTIGLVEMPPPEMTEIESGLLLATKSKKVAGDLLDKMAMSRDTQGKMV